jgi:ribosome recycling factor
MAELEKTLKTAEEKMKGAVRDLEKELSTLRTGRANAGMLDAVRVMAYGSEVPIQQVGSVSVSDAHMLTVTPWDKSVAAAIEKAIHAANLGFSPVNDGGVIRVSVPPLTEERRKELVKKGHAMAEMHRVAVRNVRRHAKDEIDALGKGKGRQSAELSEDAVKKGQDRLQKLTDENIKKIDELLAKKEKEVMTV